MFKLLGQKTLKVILRSRFFWKCTVHCKVKRLHVYYLRKTRICLFVVEVELGSICPHPDACLDNKAVCSSDSRCVCGSSYFDNNGVQVVGGVCVPSK